MDELNAHQENVIRIIPLDNFGELHPDPNLTYAKDLVDAVRNEPKYEMGAAFDGDGVSKIDLKLLKLIVFLCCALGTLMFVIF